MEDWEKRLEKGEMLIRQFHLWLHDRKVFLLNDRPIEAFNDFMSGYTNHRLDEVTPADLKWFLYDFYIRKFNPDVDPLTPLSFFFHFLTDKGVVKDGNAFSAILENQDKYRKRVRTYPSSDLAEARWREQNYEWTLQLNDEMADEIVQQAEIETLPTLYNFIHLLSYIKENEIKLTPAYGHMRLADILRVDASFVHAERPFLKGFRCRRIGIRTEEDYLYFYYLDTMARVAKYVQQRKGRLHLTAKGRYFLSLPRSAQFLRLFSIYWYEINWNFLYDHPASEEFQRLQPDVECIFRDFAEMDEVPVSRFAETLFSELDMRVPPDSPKHYFLFARGALESTILEWLEEFGIINGRRSKDSASAFESKLITFRVTPLGRRTIDYFFAARPGS